MCDKVFKTKKDAAKGLAKFVQQVVGWDAMKNSEDYSEFGVTKDLRDDPPESGVI